MKKTKKWNWTEVAQLRRVMKEADRLSPSMKGERYWKWVAKKMPGRTHKACRSKNVHVRAAENGVVKPKRTPVVQRTQTDDLVLMKLNRLERRVSKIEEKLTRVLAALLAAGK